MELEDDEFKNSGSQLVHDANNYSSILLSNIWSKSQYSDSWKKCIQLHLRTIVAQPHFDLNGENVLQNYAYFSTQITIENSQNL